MYCCVLVCRYHNGDAYIIDVSQSVEHDHPHALEFLRKDCTNVNGKYRALNSIVHVNVNICLIIFCSLRLFPET